MFNYQQIVYPVKVLIEKIGNLVINACYYKYNYNIIRCQDGFYDILDVSDCAICSY